MLKLSKFALNWKTLNNRSHFLASRTFCFQKRPFGISSELRSPKKTSRAIPGVNYFQINQTRKEKLNVKSPFAPIFSDEAITRKSISRFLVWQKTKAEYKSGKMKVGKLNKIMAEEYRNMSAQESRALDEETKRQKNLAEQKFIEKYISAEDFEHLYRGKFSLVIRRINSLRNELIESEENRQFYIDIHHVRDFRKCCKRSKKNEQIYIQLLSLLRHKYPSHELPALLTENAQLATNLAAKERKLERRLFSQIRSYHQITDEEIARNPNQLRFNKSVLTASPFAPVFSQLVACRGTFSANTIWSYNGIEWRSLLKTQSLDEQNYEVSKLPETEKRKLLKEHEDLVQQREEVFKQQFLSDDWLKQNPNCSFKDIAKSISSTYEETLASIDPDFVILVLKLHSIRKFSNPKRPMVDYSGAFKTKAIKEIKRRFPNHDLPVNLVNPEVEKSNREFIFHWNILSRLRKKFQIDGEVTKCIEVGNIDRLYNHRRLSRRDELGMRRYHYVHFLQEMKAKYPRQYERGELVKMWRSMDAEERIKFVVGDVLTKEERRAEGTSQRQLLLDAVGRNELYILTENEAKQLLDENQKLQDRIEGYPSN